MAARSSAARFLSRSGRRLKPSAIRELQPLLGIPGMLSLGGGMPDSRLFPLDAVRLGLRRHPVDGDGWVPQYGEFVDVPQASVAAAQQYANSYGTEELVRWSEKALMREHGLPRLGMTQNTEYARPDGIDERADVERSVLMTHGSQDGLFKALDVLADEGDSILVENPSYSGALAAMHAVGLKPVGIKSDHSGLDVDHLEETLKSWDFDKNPLRMVYVIPHGQNPSGSTLSVERRERLYALARTYDLLILEDDPYYFLQLPETKSFTTAVRATGSGKPLPSFLSMDADGRVLRFDSFSKIVCSGFRVGSVTGPAELVEKLQLHQQASAMQVSGIAQAVMCTILREWGDGGWRAQINRVVDHYAEQRDFALDAAEEYLREPELADFWVPSAGMFLWLKIDPRCGVKDTNALVKHKAIEAKVVMVPGTSFTPESYGLDAKPADSMYVRASYSTASPEVLDEAFRRFGQLLREEKDLNRHLIEEGSGLDQR